MAISMSGRSPNVQHRRDVDLQPRPAQGDAHRVVGDDEVLGVLGRSVHLDAPIPEPLEQATDDDPDERVRGCIGTVISAVVPSLKRLGYSDFIQGNQQVILADLEAAAATATVNPDTFMNDLVEKLRQRLVTWANPCDPVDRTNRGFAATA